MKTLSTPVRRGIALVCLSIIFAACPADQDTAKTSAKETEAAVTKEAKSQEQAVSYWKAPAHYPDEPERASRVKYGEQLVAKNTL